MKKLFKTHKITVIVVMAIALMASCKSTIKDKNDTTGPKLSLSFKTDELTEESEVKTQLKEYIKDGEPDIYLVGLPTGEILVTAGAIDEESGIKTFKLEFDPPQTHTNSLDTTLTTDSDTVSPKVLLGGRISTNAGTSFRVRAVATNNNGIESKTGWVNWDVLTEPENSLVNRITEKLTTETKVPTTGISGPSGSFFINFNQGEHPDWEFTSQIFTGNTNLKKDLQAWFYSQIPATYPPSKAALSILPSSNSYPWWTVYDPSESVKWEYGWIFYDSVASLTSQQITAIETDDNPNHSKVKIGKIVYAQPELICNGGTKQTNKTQKMVQVWRRVKKVDHKIVRNNYFYVHYKLYSAYIYTCKDSPNSMKFNTEIFRCGDTPCN